MSSIITTLAPGVHIFRPFEGAPEAIWVEYECMSTNEKVQELYRKYKQEQYELSNPTIDT